MLRYLKKTIMPLILTAAVGLNAMPVCSAQYGDADGSGTLTSADAAAILDYALNPKNVSAEILSVYDVTGDGIVSANDAAAVLCKVLDSSYKFNVEDDVTSGGDITTSGSTTETTQTTTKTHTSTETTTETTTAETTQTTTVTTTETTTVTTTETTTQTTTVTTTETTTETTTVPENGIKLGDTVYILGQSESSLPAPYSKGVSPDGLTCYSYSKDYAHYTRVGVKDGKVVSIVTFDTDAVYDSYAIGDNITPVQSNPYTYAHTVTSTRTVSAQLYYDTNDSDRVYGIILTDPTYISTTTSYTADTISELQKQIMDMTNAYRAQYSLNAYNWNSALASAAQAHAEDMANNSYFSHTGQDGSTPGKRISAKGLNYTACAENIDAGYYSAEAALNGWINSSGHRKNLISETYTHIGVGTAYNANDNLGYGTRYVQDFLLPAK